MGLMKNIFVFLFAVFIFWLCSFFIFAAERVEINTATSAQLETIVGIGPVLAQRIIDARPFISVDDLLRVKGIGEKTLQKIKGQGLAYINGQSAESASAILPSPSNAPPLAEKREATITVNNPLPTSYSDGIFINEVMPSPEGADETSEWIELFNSNNFIVDLSGWKIKDIEGILKEYTFPADTQIAGKGYLTIKRGDSKISLNNDGDGVLLIFPGGKIADTAEFRDAKKGMSYNKVEQGWQWSLSPTPQTSNLILLESSASVLPKQNKSDKEKTENIAVAAVGEAINKRPLLFSENIKEDEPSSMLLFLSALFAAIISAIVILIIKLKLKKGEFYNS